jgi:hypothetical protein
MCRVRNARSLFKPGQAPGWPFKTRSTTPFPGPVSRLTERHPVSQRSDMVRQRGARCQRTEAFVMAKVSLSARMGTFAFL